MNISLQNLHQSCKGTQGEFSKVKWPRNVKVKVKHIENHENHLLSHYFGTGSHRNFWLGAEYSWRNTDREFCLRYHEQRTVFVSRDVKHLFFLQCFLQSINVVIYQPQGQTSRSRSRKKVKVTCQRSRSRIVCYCSNILSYIILYPLYTFHLMH